MTAAGLIGIVVPEYEIGMKHLLNISEAASLAMHAMMIMTRQKQDTKSVKEMAEFLDVSENHLSKVLQRLNKAGMVESVRGPRGGYKLAADPETTTLLEIYEVVEGTLGEAKCLLGHPVCQGDNCILGGLVESVNEKVKSYLASTVLAGLNIEPKTRNFEEGEQKCARQDR